MNPTKHSEQPLLHLLSGNIPPFFAIAIFVAFGIWTTSYTGCLTISLSVSAMLAFVLSNQNCKTCFILFLASFIAGGLAYSIQDQGFKNFQELFSGKKVQKIYGVIKDVNKDPHKQFKYKTLIETSTIQTSGENINVSRKILLFSQENPNVDVGDFVHLTNSQLSQSRNKSFNRYLEKENIYGTVFTKKANISVTGKPAHSLSRYIWHTKNTILKKIEQKISPFVFSVFASIFLGYKHAAPKYTNPIKRSFLLWGISHYLARSGLHLVIFLLLWSFFLHLIPIPWRIRETIFILICVSYFCLSWTSISFFRAFGVFIICKINSFTGLQTNLFHIISLIATIVLLYNPITLFFLDFQLSFALSCALAWLSFFVGHSHR